MTDSPPPHDEGSSPPPDTPDERPAGKSPLRYLCFAVIPVVLAVVSWVLGGNAVWAWVAGISALALLLFFLASLRVVAQRDLQSGELLTAGYLLLCWGAWTA